MLSRPIVSMGNGDGGPQPAGNRVLDGRQLYAVDGDNQTIPLAALIAGIVNRTGTSANTTDVLPSVSSIVSALPQLTRGDSLAFSIRMANAHTNTLSGTGMTAIGTTGIVASNIREYLLTLTSDPKPTCIYTGTTTNASGVLSNLSNDAMNAIGIGMAVTGTGVGASAKVTAINRNNNTVTVSVVSTATADNIALTFTPQADLLGVGTRAI